MVHINNPFLDKRQQQIIYGTVLGGSSIVKPPKGKNCYLSMRGKNDKWLEYKFLELKGIFTDAPFTIEKTFRLHSMCLPMFSELKNIFYKGNERCLKGICLESLSDAAFAVWFGDAGRWVKDRIIMNTHIWGKNGTKIIKNYFKSFGHQPKIIQDMGYYRVSLDPIGSKWFWKIAEPQLPLWFLEASS